MNTNSVFRSKTLFVVHGDISIRKMTFSNVSSPSFTSAAVKQSSLKKDFNISLDVNLKMPVNV